jgi:glutamyl/glutaminyl-tRNA synthetase
MWNSRPNGLLEEALRTMIMDGADDNNNENESMFASKLLLKKSMKNILLNYDNGQHKMKDLFLPLRYAVSGTNVGADLMETMILLGKDVCIKRLQYVLDIDKRESQRS